MCVLSHEANYSMPHYPNLKWTNNVRHRLAGQSERQIIDFRAYGKLQALNKRPKGPHIVHLSTMCHLFEESTRQKFLFTDRPEKHKLGRGR